MRFLIAIGIMLISNFAHAEDATIASIRKEYQRIQQLMPSLKLETVDLDGYATEGADVTSYRDKKGNLLVIKAELFHETGKEFLDFYYKNGVLIFAFYTTHEYNQRPNITPEVAKQEGIEEGYDPKKTSITEDRYYFSNSKLIRWINENHHEVSPNSIEFKDSEQGVIETSTDLLSKFKNKR